jgi:hypothetical protein
MTQYINKRLVNRVLALLMLLFFVLISMTGIIKFPELQRYFLFVYEYMPAATLSAIHDFSGLALVVLVILHLTMKRSRLGEYLAVNLNISKSFSNIAILIAIIIIGLGSFLFVSTNFFSSNAISLSAVEVRDYKGEKLGSINDFRENSIKGIQHINKESYRLEITGLVASSAILSYNDILNLSNYEKVVTLDCVEGWSVRALWGGVLARDLLKNIVIKPEAKTIIFYAADGYSTSFPFEYIMNNNIILADKLNGVELPSERGFPLQLVAEQKWGYKWIKWITKIELSSDTNYKGFWESRGYNNNGDLKGSKFE